MENQKNSSYFAQSVSIMDILKLVLSRWYVILIVALVFAGIAGAYTKLMVAPTYDAYTTLYVFNKTEGAQGAVTSSDLTASADASLGLLLGGKVATSNVTVTVGSTAAPVKITVSPVSVQRTVVSIKTEIIPA